jgi:hypothetical protein
MLIAVFDLMKGYLKEADKSLTEEDRKNLSDTDPDNRATSVSILAINLQKLSEQITKNG